MTLKSRLARLESAEEESARRMALQASTRMGRPVEDVMPEARRFRAAARLGLGGRYPSAIIEAMLAALSGEAVDLREMVDRLGVDWRALRRDAMVATGCPPEEVEHVICGLRDRGQTSGVPSGVHQGDRP